MIAREQLVARLRGGGRRPRPDVETRQTQTRRRRLGGGRRQRVTSWWRYGVHTSWQRPRVEKRQPLACRLIVLVELQHPLQAAPPLGICLDSAR